jgi:Flp pilus assembly protein TadB
MASQPDPRSTSDPAGWSERDEREYSSQSAPDQPPPVADAQIRHIAETSPEGIPGDPGTDRRTVSNMLTILMVLLLTIALVVAVFVNRWLGLGVGVLAVFLLLANPVFWAAVLRVKERENG